MHSQLIFEPFEQMKRTLIIFLTILAMSTQLYAQKIDFQLLPELMKSQPEKFQFILDNADRLRVQIVYTQIDRDVLNRPSFTTYGFRLNPQEYFYPASTVKLPACVLALEKINQLNKKGLSKDTPMFTGAEYERHTPVTGDSTSANGMASVAHYAKKILMVSDNDAFNRLYEFMGQEGFNDRLRTKGLKDTRIVHRLEVGMSVEQNKRTNPISFKENGQVVYEQPMITASREYFPVEPIKLGKGYIKGEATINEPFEFTQKNFFPLIEQQQLLRSIIFPNAVPKEQRFDLASEDYQFLHKYMSQMPTESKYPAYSLPDYWPAYCKFLMYGGQKDAVINPNIRIFNKVGDAYGFLLDNAYIVDFEKGIEFMLSAVILCNEDQIFNDSKYDYDTIGFPFMKNLGELVYQYESNRPKKHLPNLSKFKFQYDK